MSIGPLEVSSCLHTPLLFMPFSASLRMLTQPAGFRVWPERCCLKAGNPDASMQSSLASAHLPRGPSAGCARARR